MQNASSHARTFSVSTTLLAAAFVALAPSARAETVSVAGRDIVLSPPPGHCALSESEPSDRALIASLKTNNEGRNIVLMVFGECENLRQWRRGEARTLLSHGQYLAPLSQGRPRALPTYSRADAMREVAAALPQIPWQDVAKEVQQRWARQGYAQSETMKTLGVLHSDEASVLMGILLPVAGPDPAVQTAAGVVAITLVNEVIVSINLYRPFVDQSTVEALVSEQRRNIEALISSNDAAPRSSAQDERADRPDASGIDWREIGISAAIGSAVFALLVGLFVLFQRLRESLNG